MAIIRHFTQFNVVLTTINTNKVKHFEHPQNKLTYSYQLDHVLTQSNSQYGLSLIYGSGLLIEYPYT